MEKETEESTIACVKKNVNQGMNKVTRFLHDYKDTVTDSMKVVENCIPVMTTIADELDKFHRGATIASVTGSSFGILGGIATIVGLALIPVTLGASLIVSAVGIGVAVAGGVTGASASIADTVNIKKNSKRAQDMVDQINEKMKHLKEISNNIKSEIVKINEFNDPRLFARGIFTTVEIGRLAQLTNITAVASRGVQIAAKGAQAAAAVSGVIAALFIIVDAVFIVQGAIHLHKGSKTEEAAKIREQVEELKKIYQDLEIIANAFTEDLLLLSNDKKCVTSKTHT